MRIEDPDIELVRACQDTGKEQFEAAFERLYEKYKDRVYNIAWRVTGNSAEALDVCQETFVLLLRNISRFKFNSKFSTWLYRIVVNTSIDSKRRMTSRGRREGVMPTNPETGGQVEIEDESNLQPGEHLLGKEKGEMVQAGIDRLSPKLRAIVVLRYMEGLSYDDLGQTLEISLGTVKSRLARAHIALAKVLDGVLTHPGMPEKADDHEDTGEPSGG